METFPTSRAGRVRPAEAPAGRINDVYQHYADDYNCISLLDGALAKVWVYPPYYLRLMGLHMGTAFLVLAIAGAVCLGLSAVSSFYTGILVGGGMVTLAGVHYQISRAEVRMHYWLQAVLWFVATVSMVFCLLVTGVRFQVLIGQPLAPWAGSFPDHCTVLGGCARLSLSAAAWPTFEDVPQSSGSSTTELLVQSPGEWFQVTQAVGTETADALNCYVQGGAGTARRAVASDMPATHVARPPLSQEVNRRLTGISLRRKRLGAQAEYHTPTQPISAQKLSAAGHLLPLPTPEGTKRTLQTTERDAALDALQNGDTPSPRLELQAAAFSFVASHSSPASVWPPSLAQWWVLSGIAGGPGRSVCSDRMEQESTSGGLHAYDSATSGPVVDLTGAGWYRALVRGMSVPGESSSDAGPNPVWLGQRGFSALQYPGASWQVREALLEWVSGQYQTRVVRESDGYMQIEVLTDTLGFPDDIYVRWGCALGRTAVELHSEQRIGLRDFGTNEWRAKTIVNSLLEHASAADTPAAPCQ